MVDQGWETHWPAVKRAFRPLPEGVTLATIATKVDRQLVQTLAKTSLAPRPRARTTDEDIHDAPAEAGPSGWGQAFGS